jgi:hypothetical protein
MANQPSQSESLSFLKMEYERLCTDIRSVESRNEQSFVLGASVLGTGAAFGIKDDIDLNGSP